MRLGRRAVIAMLSMLSVVGIVLQAFSRLRFLRINHLRTRPMSETIPPDAATILVRASEALIGMPIETSHYDVYFRWRLDNVDKARALYLDFLNAIRREAADVGDFASADLAKRETVLNRIRPHQAAVCREILALFARTDAWVLAGYEGWPGTARGFATFRRLPANSSSAK